MTVGDIILYVIGKNSENKIKGRTRLQKTLYFISVLLNQNARFLPHYYGPYSEVVSSSLDALVARGLVEQDVKQILSEGPFDGRLYEYSLTKEGKEVFTQLIKEQQADCKKVDKVIVKLLESEPSTRALAVASKLHFIVSQAAHEIPVASLQIRAKKLGWAIKPRDIEEGINFLLAKDLVKKVTKN